MVDLASEHYIPESEKQPIYPIIYRNKGNPSNPSRPENFLVDRSVPLDLESISELIFTPYAVDFGKRTIVEVGVPIKIPPVRRPFFYLDQFHDASAVRDVPVEIAANCSSAKLENGKHIFIFGIGRAGSTLVSKLLSVGGIASVSEPDVLLDLGRGATLDELGIDFDTWKKLYIYCLTSIEARFGHPSCLAVKFRAQSSNRFHTGALHRLFPSARFLFLFRDPVQWSASFITKFGFQAATLKWLLTENLLSASKLKEQGADIQLWRYEDIKAGPEEFVARCTGQVVKPSAGLIDVMSVDSQEGMFDSIPGVKQKAKAESEKEAFLEWWAGNPLAELLTKLDLDLYLSENQ